MGARSGDKESLLFSKFGKLFQTNKNGFWNSKTVFDFRVLIV
jgi:hypothetical protein